MPGARADANRWLYGPARDLLLGCGALYVLLFLVFVVAGPGIRQAQAHYLVPLLMLLVSTPHYGATLVRAYERREDRRAYAFFTVWLTLGLCAVFVVGAFHESVGTVMVTTYLTWSPWHYTGQNYGIAVMFLRRRGIDLPGPARRWLYASFVLSFCLTFLVMHGADGSGSYANSSFQGAGIRFAPLGIPESVTGLAVPVSAAAYLVALAGAASSLLRLGSARDLLPVAVLCLTQALWFTVPQAARHWNASGGLEVLDYDHRAVYFSWVVFGHAVQYLWITSYYAKASGGWRGQGRYLGKTLLAGNAVWMLPALLLTTGGFGRLSYDLGLGFLVAALVNLHHFVLDGAIWKLRSSRIAAVLIRSRPATAAARAKQAPPRSRGLRGLAWTGAVLLLAAALAELRESQIVLPAAFERRDHAAVRSSLGRLAWLGRDSAPSRAMLGRALAEDGHHQEALAEFERSLALQPGVDAYEGLGLLHAREGRWQRALHYYALGLAIDPDDALLLSNAGAAQLAAGQPERAAASFERALRSDPGSEASRSGLARARREIRGLPD